MKKIVAVLAVAFVGVCFASSAKAEECKTSCTNDYFGNVQCKTTCEETASEKYARCRREYEACEARAAERRRHGEFVLSTCSICW